ncbi:MAG: hypothetical protein JNL39_21240 [Opitutaceae bacterium]|nr:hypothetical protein [Opitutaceae bacterium]
MKRMLVAVALGAAASMGATAAEEKFSKTIPAADFSAAGLAKLSAEELARLDALIRDYKSGALAAAQREAAVAAEGKARAEAKAARAEEEARATKLAADAKARAAEEAAAKKAETSLLARAKVLLTPGTQIDYAAAESRIAGGIPRLVGAHGLCARERAAVAISRRRHLCVAARRAPGGEDHAGVARGVLDVGRGREGARQSDADQRRESGGEIDGASRATPRAVSRRRPAARPSRRCARC